MYFEQTFGRTAEFEEYFAKIGGFSAGSNSVQRHINITI